VADGVSTAGACELVPVEQPAVPATEEITANEAVAHTNSLRVIARGLGISTLFIRDVSNS
jgi:hypothetical protein